MRIAYHQCGAQSINQPSQRRSLLQDASDGIAQQMFFWGCDVQHAAGNLLVRAGMERIARKEAHGEGSSRYRMPWLNGWVEIHSFCAGWYPGDSTQSGAIFIRKDGRLRACSGGEPLMPGRYEPNRLLQESPDMLLEIIPPFISWILHHEQEIRRLAGSDYRARCWEAYRTNTGAMPWLQPGEAETWFTSLMKAPERTRRARSRRHPRPANSRFFPNP